jgi:hypothetical protein
MATTKPGFPAAARSLFFSLSPQVPEWAAIRRGGPEEYSGQTPETRDPNEIIPTHTHDRYQYVMHITER